MMRTTKSWHQTAENLLVELRARQPLVHCLTNTVTTNLVANALLALGASPAMVDIPGEAGVFAQGAGAVLINLGTPSSQQREAMREAATAAHPATTPWVLDPVGIGALPVRTQLARELLKCGPSIIRGNASEIRVLGGDGPGGKGVDAADEVDTARDAAGELARTTGAVVAISGAHDLITDGHTTVRVDNGDPLFTRITGAGCALGAVTAAFAAVAESPLDAAVSATLTYTIAGERAAQYAQRPGSFAVALLDALDGIDGAAIHARGRTA